MAGIFGSFGHVDKKTLVRMSAALAPRGIKESLASGALAAVGQRLPHFKHFPTVLTKNGEQVLVAFDGDMFNKAELIELGRSAGHAPNSDDDTAIVLSLYRAFGTDFPRYIEGNFALAIAEGSSLYLARDTLGVRPLFYHNGGESLFFASEMKAILPHTPLVDIDRESLHERFVFRDPLGGDSTYFTGIKHVHAGGHVVATTRDNGIALEIGAYGASEKVLPTDESELRELLSKTVLRNVNHYVHSGGSVGVLLSGGFDSSVLLALAKVAGAADLKTFTLSDDALFPDVTAARSVARHAGTRHEEIIINTAASCEDVVDSIFTYEDPIVRNTIYKLAQSVAGKVDIAMSGAGADLLGMPLLARRKVFGSVRRRVEQLPEGGGDRVCAYTQTMPKSPENIDAWAFKHFIEDYLPQQLFPSTERALMRFCIEPAFPFADQAILAIARALPRSQKYDANEEKPFLRETFRSLDLPVDIHVREKLCSKETLKATKRNISRLAGETISDAYVAAHPYRDLLERNKYIIMHFDIFKRMFVNQRGARSDGSFARAMFEASPWLYMLRGYFTPLSFRRLFGKHE